MRSDEGAVSSAGRPRLPSPSTMTSSPAARWSCLLIALAGCAPSMPAAPRVPFVPYVPEPGTAEAVAYEAGITRYLGETRVVSERLDGTDSIYELDPESGPICMRGEPFRASTREGASDELLVFLQGGGACWSDFCFAITTAPGTVPSTDLLRVEDANPLADADLLYLPYCDGSLFAGDAEIDEDGDGATDRFHRGLANLSAALAIGFERFPHPSRVVLAGSSGGGFGTILAVFLVRYVYPGVPIVVLDDAGIGVARPEDPTFVSGLLDEFGARAFLPADCADCIADGNVTGLVDYALDHDPDLRIAAISSHYDYVISDVFLGISAVPFQAALIAETDALHAEHPDAYRRFLYAGDAHTALLGGLSGLVGGDLGAVELPPDTGTLLSHLTLESMHTARANDLLLVDWIEALLAGDAGGAPDTVAEPGPVPEWATMP
jgi:hypothetical protein